MGVNVKDASVFFSNCILLQNQEFNDEVNFTFIF